MLQLVFAVNYTLAYLEWRLRQPTAVVAASAKRESPLAALVAAYRCGQLDATEVERWPTRDDEAAFLASGVVDAQTRRAAAALDRRVSLLISPRSIQVRAKSNRSFSC